METRYDNTPVRASFHASDFPFPKSARIVIVGGGIAGAGMAYHFAKAGWKDVHLLEQSKLASGTTWHSAGQVGQLRSSSAQTKVNKASTELFASLLADTGHDPGWLQCGGLQLASCTERLLQLQRNAAMAEVFGVEARLITPEQCREYYPMMHIADVIGGVHLPGDGRVLPGECTIALAKGAMQRGVAIHEGVRVTGLLHHKDSRGIKRITGVSTTQGEITAEWVVLAGNMWMRQLGLAAGIDIPVYPCEHHYVVTRPIDGVTRNSPCSRDPDAGLYFRALDDGGMKLGAFKKRSKPWQIGDAVPQDFSFGLLEPDWPDFAEPFAAHCHRLRGITRDDVVKFVNGPEAFTPDNNFLMGQPHATEGLFVLGGWNSAGIACSGGASKYAVEWIENGGMSLDLGSVDIRRFLPFQNGRAYLQERVSEVLGLHYQMAWPNRQMETSRGIRASGLYDRHRALNAVFVETAGWERPLAYAPVGIEPGIGYTFLRQNWQPWAEEESLACRGGVALLDQSTFAKFEASGPGALRLLQYLCGGNIDVPVGKTVYTGLFNAKGTFESDLTVIRTASEAFYLVTGTAQQSRDADWLLKHLPNDGSVSVRDVTEAINVVSVMGPQAFEVLAPLFDVTDFPFGTSREAIVADIPLRAVHISYVGEPGLELHVAKDRAGELWDHLMVAGGPHGIRPIGTHAINTLRIEKAFRAYGHELSAAETPLEAGLGFAVDWSKDFLGKEVLVAQKTEGVRKRLICLVLDEPEPLLWGGEPILWDGEPAGYTTSAAWSPTLGRSVALGYVKRSDRSILSAASVKQGSFAIHLFGRHHSAKPVTRAV
ncbi:FAD-dependent oxidoreductase [Luteolibacter arcticus]|uniref:FAD-dependent oxidoreductase n=1 Tax=Luteolibacter arcticus TaxID=1581411 RepID=A0ABT3GHM3_9BACT|nr:FAD-dependent oxidoreductase [Luteolibacter arcticus]MCW1922644.1 FAD-dependent oxidoreductase [Luteolibacter arcticus]